MRTEISPSKGHTAPPLSLASQSRSKHGALRLLLGVLLTVAVFSYLFSSISLRSVVRSLRDLEPTGIAVFVMLSLTASLARSWRYQLLLRSSGHVVGTRPLFLVTLVRNLCSDLLPARLGSAVYIYLATSRLHLPLSVATSSFGISLVFDIISLPPLMLFLLGNSKELGIPPLLLGGAVGIVIVLTGTLVYFSSYILRSLPPMKLPFPNSILKPLREIFEQAESDLFRLRSPLLFSHVYLLSILLRFLKYLSLVIFFYSLLLALDYPTESFSSAKAFIGILVSELAASLPISGIGGFGAYEGAWAVTFRLLGLPGWMADTTALTHHLFTQGYGYLLGLSALIALSLPKKRKTNEPREISRALSSAPVIGKHLLLLLMPIILSLFYLSEKRAAKATPPHTPQQLSAATPLSPLPEGIEVIFDSNQSGTFGIYLLSERGEVALVDSHAHEMYPALSHDERRLVFARSQTTSRSEPGEIWELTKEDRVPRKIVSNGTFPSFIGDGHDLLFERARSSVMRFQRTTGTEEKLFPNQHFPQFDRTEIVKPQLSYDERYLVFTSDIPAPWHIWKVDLQEHTATLLGAGCQPSFHRAGGDALYISKERPSGRPASGGSGIFSFSLRNEKKAICFDSPKEEKTHEYFPSVGTRGEWLAFSATSEEEHSHITANYDLFLLNLKQRDTPAGLRPLQLTNNPATERWPKITRSSWGTTLSLTER